MHFVQKWFTALDHKESVPHLIVVFILSFKNMNDHSRNRNKCLIFKSARFTSDIFFSIVIISIYITSKRVLDVADLYVLMYIQ